MKKKKVLFYITTLDGGGAEKVLINLLRQINLDKYKISVVTLFDHGKHVSLIPDKVRYKAIFHSDNVTIRKLETAFAYRVLPAKWFYRLFLHGDYDIEVGYLTGYPSKVIQNSTSKTSKKICFIHGSVEEDGFLEKFYDDLDNARILFSNLDKLCFISQATMDGFIRKCGKLDNMLVLHNVVDVDEILAGAEQVIDTGFSNRNINIVSIGRLTQVKGYDRLLRVIKRLNEFKSQYTLSIIGEGDMKNELQEFIQNNGLTNVRLIPFTKNPFPYVKDADLFVCSSFSEGYSTAVSEAALIGTPVITTDCDGMREIYHDVLGCRIVPNDEDSLYDELKIYLSDPEYRKKLAAEAVVKAKTYQNEVRNNCTRYEALFDEV